MKTLQSYIRKSDAFKTFAKNRKGNIEVEGLDGFPLFQCAHLMAESIDGITWMICPTEEAARVLFSNNSLVSGVPTIMLPTSGRVLYSPWEGSSKEYEQIRALGAILNSPKALVVTSLRAVCSPIPKRSAIEQSSLTFKVGQSLDTMEIANRLAEGNYFRSPNTTIPGEFTIRQLAEKVVELTGTKSKLIYQTFLPSVWYVPKPTMNLRSMMLKNFTCEGDTLTSEGFISHTLSDMFLQGI